MGPIQTRKKTCLLSISRSGLEICSRVESMCQRKLALKELKTCDIHLALKDYILRGKFILLHTRPIQHLELTSHYTRPTHGSRSYKQNSRMNVALSNACGCHTEDCGSNPACTPFRPSSFFYNSALIRKVPARSWPSSSVLVQNVSERTTRVKVAVRAP